MSYNIYLYTHPIHRNKYAWGNIREEQNCTWTLSMGWHMSEKKISWKLQLRINDTRLKKNKFFKDKTRAVGIEMTAICHVHLYLSMYTQLPASMYNTSI